jgi:glycosyltransferase involved in cell wall biosynthesis
MKVALIHDWLNGMRGGEKILEVLCELFPRADIYTLLCERGQISSTIARMPIKSSLLQSLPLNRTKYRYYLPIFPWLIERFNLESYDLVISTSHCVAKGARAPERALNICYCLTPMRYVWYFSDDYFGRWGWKRHLLRPVFSYLKHWDITSAKRVDRWLAISQNVAARIQTIYNRHADIIYPPVDADFYSPGAKSENYYLIVSALVPYKRIDIAVKAFNELKRPLKIAGTGPERDRLEAIAEPHVRFVGWRTNAEIRDLYRGCRAFIFPGEEDFGITPLEAQACGRPVIAYGKGGVLETVRDGETGVFFKEQSAGALVEAVRKADRLDFEPKLLRENARGFGRRIFKEKLKNYIERAVAEF